MTTEADENARVRSYLVTQAAKLSLPEIVDKLRRDSQGLREASADIPSGKFNVRPADGEWSAAEVWSHVLDMNEQGCEAIEAILEGGRAPAQLADVVSGATREGLGDTAGFWRSFSGRRERLYDRVLGARGDEHLDVKITHEWFGDLNWREWLLFMRVHDLDHARQLATVAAAVPS